MYKKYNFFSFFIFYGIFMLLVSCKNGSINDPTTYFRYVIDKKNGLFQEKTVGNYTFSLQYKPPTYMVLTDNENVPLNIEGFVQQEKEYETNQYYTLRIRVASDTEHLDIITYHLNSEQEYNERVQYLEAEIQKNIFLVCGKDTSKVSAFVYDKSSDLNDYSNFLLTFPVPANIDMDRTFVFYDKKFKSGIITFKIEAAAIANTPEFKL